jgi:hypothetical protein
MSVNQSGVSFAALVELRLNSTPMIVFDHCVEAVRGELEYARRLESIIKSATGSLPGNNLFMRYAAVLAIQRKVYLHHG